MLNLRYLAIGMSVAPSLRGGPVRRLFEAQLAVDESWAIAQRDGRVDRDRLVGAGLLLMASWTTGTVWAWSAAARSATRPTTGSTQCSLRSSSRSLVGQLNSPRARVAAVAGALIALALTPLLPPGLPIVAAAAGAIIALLVPAQEVAS